jgi:hypothetical protein
VLDSRRHFAGVLLHEIATPARAPITAACLSWRWNVEGSGLIF